MYAGIAAANTLFTALRSFLFAYGAVCAAGRIHSRLLDRVLKVRGPEVRLLSVASG